MTDDSKPYGLRPEVEAVWNFPLFEALTGRRSRRFGFGMELTHGPFVYKSPKEPYPLSENETAMLVAAATGVTGAILCEGDTQGGMVKSVGRTHPSAVGAHRTVLFFTNDDGLFLYQGTKHKMSKMKEYETPEDRTKIKSFYDEHTVKISDGRFDLHRSEPGLFAHNLWVTNMPGTTLFMPVTDVSQDLIRLMVNMCDAKGGARYTKGGGYYIVDERKGMRAAGCETPVVVTGGIHGFRQAEDILARGQADIVGLARQSLADPDWFRKVHLGRGGEVTVCEYTNYCEALDQKHVPVTCKLWDRTGLDEPGIAKTADGRRRLTAPTWKASHD